MMHALRDPRHRLAELLADRKKYAEAAAVYREITTEQPNDLEAFRKLCDSLLYARRYNEAVEAHVVLSDLYRAWGSPITALATSLRALKLAQRYTENWGDSHAHLEAHIAVLREETDRVREAMADYEDVVRALEHNGRLDDAIEMLRRMAAVDPGNPVPHVRLAEAMCHTVRVDEAIEEFRTAAWTLVRLRRFTDAVKVVERILHFRQDPRDSQFSAWLYLENGGQVNGIRAIARLQPCFAASPDDLDTLLMLSRAFGYAGHHDKAFEVRKELAILSGDQEETELRREIIDLLLDCAPGDAQVQALARSAGAIDADSGHGTSALRETMASIVEEETVMFDDGISNPIVDEISEVSVLSGVWVEPVISPAVRRALDEAEVFIRLRLYPKAQYVLEDALETEPFAVELLEKLREVLWAAGDRGGFVDETLALVSAQLERKNYDRCRELLSEVLEVAPDHDEAQRLFAAVSRGEASRDAKAAGRASSSTAPSGSALG